MKARITIFIILTLAFTTLFAQYEWSDPILLAPPVIWPDASYGEPNIIVDKIGTVHAYWVKKF